MFVAYGNYPDWTLERAIRAVEARDVVKLEAAIDWPRVRSGLKSDFIAPALIEKTATGDGFAALGAAIGMNLVNTMIDNMVSAQMLIDRANETDFANHWRKAAMDGRFLSVTTYGVDISPASRPHMRATLIMEMQGLEWRIVRLLPSPEMIADLKAEVATTK